MSAILEVKRDLAPEIISEFATDISATLWAQSFTWVSDIWNYNLTSLIPEPGETYQLKTLVATILTYGALFRLSLMLMIGICPFAQMRRALMRLQYRLFGV